MRQPGRVALGVLLIVFAASFIRNFDESGDFRGYLEVGGLVLDGGDIYADARPGVNTWPPLFSVLFAPIALLARALPDLTRIGWFLLNGLLIWGIVDLATELVYARRVSIAGDPGTVPLASGAVLGPLVLASRFVLGNLDRLQINILILYASLLGCVLIRRGRSGTGGAIIGAAAAVKVLPVFLVPYFAWKRWWRACAAAIVTGAVCSVLPVLVFGFDRWWEYTRRWIGIASGGWPVRKGNQSVYAMVDRFHSHRDALHWPDVQFLVASDDPVVAAIVYGMLGVLALAVVALGRGSARSPGSPAVPVEVGLVLAVAMLFSPLAWKHYFVFFLPGYVVLWRTVFPSGLDDGGRVLEELPWMQRRRLFVVLVVAFALTTLTVRGTVGRSAAIVFQSYSALTMGGLVLVGGLVYLRAMLREQER